MTLRIEPQLYERIAEWALRDGQSLDAMTLELFEAALDVWDKVEAEEAGLVHHSIALAGE